MTDVSCQKNVLGLGDSFFYADWIRKLSFEDGHTYMVCPESLPEVCDKLNWLTSLVQGRRGIHFVTEATSFGRSP